MTLIFESFYPSYGNYSNTAVTREHCAVTLSLAGKITIEVHCRLCVIMVVTWYCVLLSLWSSLQSSMKTTSPLYAWSKSHVEDQYFAALKVDPMVKMLVHYFYYWLVTVAAGLYNIVIC